MRDYKKPKLPPPESPWLLLGPTGGLDGPFYTENLVPSDLERKPWVLVGGSPRVLRVKKQRGNCLVCEDGDYYVLMTPTAYNPVAWPVLDFAA